MPSFNFMPMLEPPPRRVTVPEFDYIASLVIIYILVVLFLTSNTKAKQTKNKQWRWVSVSIFVALTFFIFANVWIQIQPPIAPSLPLKSSVTYSYGTLRGIIKGTIFQSANIPAKNKEIFVREYIYDENWRIKINNEKIKTVYTDSQGRFIIDSLEEGKYYIVYIVDGVNNIVAFDTFVSQGEMLTYNYNLSTRVAVQTYRQYSISEFSDAITDNTKKSSIGGAIFKEPNKPLEKIQIVLYGTIKNGDINFATQVRMTFTDKEGKYLFDLLEPGKYKISIGDHTTGQIAPTKLNQKQTIIIGESEHITDYNYIYSNP